LPKEEEKITLGVGGRVNANICKAISPHIISLAVGLAVSNKAGTVLVEELVALCAFETRGVPLQVRRHPQDVLVVDLGAATNT